MLKIQKFTVARGLTAGTVSPLIAVLVVVRAANGQEFRLNMWEAKSAWQNVIQSPSAGCIRLGNSRMGWAEGRVQFPECGIWEVTLVVVTDEDPRSNLGDTLTMRIDGGAPILFLNDPRATYKEYVFTTRRQSFNFHVEWSSGNSTDHLHMLLAPGSAERIPCYADCDCAGGGGLLDIFDFLCFQNRYDAADPFACDCDTASGPGVCDIFDFLCFQNAFAAGCS